MVWCWVQSFLIGRYSGEEQPEEKQIDPIPGIQRQIAKTRNELTNLIQRSASMTDKVYQAFESVIKSKQTKLKALEANGIRLQRNAQAPPRNPRRNSDRHIGNTSVS